MFGEKFSVDMLKKSEISREIAYRNILEWLYTHDGKYPDKIKWREDLIDMLRFNLL